MDRNVKMMKKTLEIDSKRKKSLMVNRKTLELLQDKSIITYEVPVVDYNKNVTKMTRESNNKRCMLFPLYDINTLITFISKSGNISNFTIKWYENKKQIEAGVVSVHIYANKETKEVQFTTLYTLAINGNPNKSMKVLKVNFEFDNHEVVRIGNNTTKEESFQSIGYVLLENICEYLTKVRDDNYEEEFLTFFNKYSEIGTEQEIESFNIDNIVSLLNSKEKIEDDELLASKYL